MYDAECMKSWTSMYRDFHITIFFAHCWIAVSSLSECDSELGKDIRHSYRLSYLIGERSTLRACLRLYLRSSLLMVIVTRAEFSLVIGTLGKVRNLESRRSTLTRAK
jgi:hypothetical protein